MTTLDLLNALARHFDGIAALYPIGAPYEVVLCGADIASELRWLALSTPEATPAGVVLLGWHIGLVPLVHVSPRIPMVVRAEQCSVLHSTGSSFAGPIDRYTDRDGYASWTAAAHSSTLDAVHALWRRWTVATTARAERHGRLAAALREGELADMERARAADLTLLAAHLRREQRAIAEASS